MSVVETQEMTEAERAAHVARTEEAMRANGVPTEETVYEDYFDTTVEHKVILPDGKQFIVHQELNEGARRKYLNAVNRDVVIQRATGDARMRMAPGDERHALLEAAITGWNVMKAGTPLPFTPANLRLFLDKAPPRIIDLIEKEVRKANPWLLAEMSVEDIDKEIASLQEMRDTKLREEEGKGASASK